MRIPSGKTDISVYFVAVDSVDLQTRETGLTNFTVYRSRNGAAEVAYTTPTVVEIDATNMPGVYALLIDEDTTIASGSDSEEYCLHITQASMAPVTKTIELYRRDTTTGTTLTVASGGEVNDLLKIGGVTQTGGDLYPAIKGIGTSTGAALSTDATTDNTAGGLGVTSGTTFIGSQSGTFVDAMSQDLVYHEITHTGNAIDIVYQFDIGTGTAPTVCVWIGYLTGNNDQFTISVWSHVDAVWDPMATILGQSGTTNLKHDCPLFPRYVGTSVAELGKVYIRLHCTGQTAPVLHTDQIYVSYAVTSTDTAAIKAKTDSLTFTVAGQLDANLQYVNDVQVTGTGATGNEWGP